LAAYEAMARKLADDPSLLQGYRDSLNLNRDSAPLFDNVRFRRNLEAAYTAMWERHRQGEPPQNIAV
jgi:protein O-GlcNAc transferase